MRFLILLFCLQASFAFSQSLPGEPMPPDEKGALFSFGEEMLQRINYLRLKDGLPLLYKSEAAICAAGLHATYLAETGTCDHAGRAMFPRTRDRLKLCGQPTVAHAEAIACGYNTAYTVLEDWLRSPHHAAIIMDDRYTQFGAAMVDQTWVLVLIE